MFKKATENKIKMTKQATKSEVGKGNNTIIDVDSDYDEVLVRDEKQVFVAAILDNMETNQSEDEGSNKEEEDIGESRAVNIEPNMNLLESETDPSTSKKGLEEMENIAGLSWIDDCLCTGNNEGVKEAKEQFKIILRWTMWDHWKRMWAAKLMMTGKTIR